MARINIEVIGDSTEILEFVALCGKIELLGHFGANRTIPVTVDGDGSGQLLFKANATVDGKENVDLIGIWKTKQSENFESEVDSEIKEHHIGE